MDENFKSRLDVKLGEFRGWFREHQTQSCRLVQYCGVDLVGALDIPVQDIESQIERLVCEGFYVDWTDQAHRLYLRVWEHGGPVPPWSRVFAEQPVVDISGLLQDLGDEA